MADQTGQKSASIIHFFHEFAKCLCNFRKLRGWGYAMTGLSLLDTCYDELWLPRAGTSSLQLGLIQLQVVP